METQQKLDNLNKSIEALKEKSGKIFFYIFDSKGMPSGTLYYMYCLAKSLKESGYDVRMLHADKEFIGVNGWLGEEYSEIPHYNIQKDNVALAPEDILFVPEILSNVMGKVKNSFARIIAVVTNYAYLVDSIRPYKARLSDFGISDCITPSEELRKQITEAFPEIRTTVVKPYIRDIFKYNPKEEKPLVVNIVAKSPSEASKIINPFYWKHPEYGFIAIRHLTHLPQEELAKGLDGSFMTVWLDGETAYGYSALEAMACGSIVVGKIPENIPDWMLTKDGELRDNGIWYYNTHNVHSIMADAIHTYLHDALPSELYKEMDATVKEYRSKEFNKAIKKYIDNSIAARIKEYTIIASAIKREIEKEEKNG